MLLLTTNILGNFYHVFMKLPTYFISMFKFKPKPRLTSKLAIDSTLPIELQVDGFIDVMIKNFEEKIASLRTRLSIAPMLTISIRLAERYLEKLLVLKENLNNTKMILAFAKDPTETELAARKKILKLFIAGVLYDLNKILRKENDRMAMVAKLIQNPAHNRASQQYQKNYTALNQLFSNFLSDAGSLSLFSFMLIDSSENWREKIRELLLAHPSPEIQRIACDFYQHHAFNLTSKKLLNLKIDSEILAMSLKSTSKDTLVVTKENESLVKDLFFLKYKLDTKPFVKTLELAQRRILAPK